ncbi:MAG: tRNA-dihydrouridine synthase family protein [Clostridia bacterium]|nr:tRNA-dihydrouridine synthase family protein [Clostridia bacterium]
MNLYFAPMEGITSYTYRNAHAEVFGMCDAYFTPFIVPTEHERISRKTLRDVLKENNSTKIKPQVLCNSVTAFLEFTKKLSDLGFDEVNLNLGCPSGTVIKKSRGAGALKDTDALDRFLEGIFSGTDIKISIKTRAGFNSHDEFGRLLEIYNQYPITELIIHPRVREEYYHGFPNMQTFEKAYHGSNLKLCYNGNIYTLDDYERIAGEYPQLNSIMIGRGAIKNPALFREIKGGDPLKTSELILFSKLLEERFLRLLGSEVYTLHRLKEIWLYAMLNFPGEKKILKAVKKSNRLSDLNNAIHFLPEL